MSKQQPGAPRQRAFHFNQQACHACKACQMACKDLHDLPVGVNWRRVTTKEQGVFPRPRVFHLSLACNHCERPACAAACPEGALYKRESDGVVLLDHERCLGCLACADACPYGAIQHNPQTDTVGKCDFCDALLARGEEPACVTACPMRALTAGWLDELDEGGEARGPGLPDPAPTGPALRITPHRDARGE